MKQLDTYLRDLDINDTITINDKHRNGEEDFEEIYLDSPDVDTLIDLVSLYQ